MKFCEKQQGCTLRMRNSSAEPNGLPLDHMKEYNKACSAYENMVWLPFLHYRISNWLPRWAMGAFILDSTACRRALAPAFLTGKLSMDQPLRALYLSHNVYWPHAGTSVSASRMAAATASCHLQSLSGLLYQTLYVEDTKGKQQLSRLWAELGGG